MPCMSIAATTATLLKPLYSYCPHHSPTRAVLRKFAGPQITGQVGWLPSSLATALDAISCTTRHDPTDGLAPSTLCSNYSPQWNDPDLARDGLVACRLAITFAVASDETLLTGRSRKLACSWATSWGMNDPGRAQYTAQELASLEYYNDRVGAFLWAGIGAVILIASLVRLTGDTYNWRRRQAAVRALYGSPPRSAATLELNESASIWSNLPAFVVGCTRKIAVGQPRWLESLQAGDIGQNILILIYLALNLILVFIRADGGIDYYAHHAGNLCFANLPIIIGLAAKNNLISLVTGYSYESLNLLHRWSARLFLVLSVIHVAGRVHVNVPDANPALAGAGYICWGYAGWGAFILLILGATRFIRNLNYQLFKASHIALVLTGMISMVVHRPQRYGWLLAGLLLWALDTIARTARVVYHHLIKTVKELPGHPRAWVEALSDDTLRVTVVTTQTWVPGQHAYIFVPSLALGGHPFSIASNSRPLEQTDNAHPRHANQVFIVRKRGGFTLKLHDHAMGLRQALISPRKGDTLPPITRQLLDREKRKEEGDAPDLEAVKVETITTRYPWKAIHAWSEGAYGLYKNYGQDYQTLILFMGGSGVSHGLPIALDIVRRAKAMERCQSDQLVVTQKIVFVWVVRDPSHLAWIEADLQDAMMRAPPGLLHVRIHCSRADRIPADRLYRPESDGDPSRASRFIFGDLSHMLGKSKAQSSEIVFHSGRPRVDQIIEEEVAATAPRDWVAVGVCGPSSLTQAVQEATAKSIKPLAILKGEHRRNIKLSVEAHGW